MDLNDIAKEAGFEFSTQAIRILSKLANPEQKAKELVELVKKRKFIIGGGDVLRFMTSNSVPNSPSNSEDING